MLTNHLHGLRNGLPNVLGVLQACPRVSRVKERPGQRFRNPPVFSLTGSALCVGLPREVFSEVCGFLDESNFHDSLGDGRWSPPPPPDAAEEPLASEVSLSLCTAHARWLLHIVLTVVFQ